MDLGKTNPRERVGLFCITINRYFAATGGDTFTTNPKLAATTLFNNIHT